MIGRGPDYDADGEDYNLEKEGDILVLDPHPMPDHLPDWDWSK